MAALSAGQMNSRQKISILAACCMLMVVFWLVLSPSVEGRLIAIESYHNNDIQLASQSELTQKVQHRPTIGKVTVLYGNTTLYERPLRAHEEHTRRLEYSQFILLEPILEGVWSKPAYILTAEEWQFDGHTTFLSFEESGIGKDVFYQAFWQATRSRIAISSEWTEKGNGRIDFYIVGPSWGFELLRDGDRIEEDHCARFRKHGIYHPWIQAHSLREWIILDCRHSIPRTTYPNQPNLWRVVFLEEYSRVLVLDYKNQHLAEFGLANR